MTNFWDNLPQPFFALAPMEAVTDVVFRHVVARAGAPDVWFSEFTNATGWVHAGQKAIGGRLIKTDDEQPIVAQIWGGEPGDMEQLALHCKELGFHGIDINMGCPAKSAIKSGGSALIRKPEVAVAAIAAAKTAGLPVSVKTRLGYTHVDEWRDWLRTLLEQDIVNLTIHLRTKREMSKVPAHFELIDEIVALRDEVAPHTLLTINGDVRDHAHGMELIEKHPGVNGIMIGRGIFHNPFAFAPRPFAPSLAIPSEHPTPPPSPISPSSSSEFTFLLNSPLETSEERSAEISHRVDSTASSEDFGGEDANGPEENTSEDPTQINETNETKAQLFDLLNYHLDLFDRYQAELNRPFETLKRFFKIYIRDFDGAKELREKLMHCKNTDEVRELLSINL